MREFDTFSDAFRYALDKEGLRPIDVYPKINMDAGYFSNIYTGEVKNPQSSTRQKLLSVVDFDIVLDGKKWSIEYPDTDKVHAQKKSQYSHMNTELGNQVQEKITRYLEAKKGTDDNLQDPVLVALRDQLQSQRSMLDAQMKNLDSMIVILDSLIDK